MSRHFLIFAAAALCAGLATPDPTASQVPLGIRTASGLTVSPVYEGWYENADGTFSLSFGYYNRNFEEVVEIPSGAANHLEPADYNGTQPTRFHPRRHWGVFAVTVPADFGDQAVVRTIDFRGERFSIPGRLHTDWEIDALDGEAETGNTPPVLAFAEGGPEGAGPGGVWSEPVDADAGTGSMHRVVCRSQYPHGDEGIAQYLDALDWVLDDGVIDRAERAAMDDLAMEWGISTARQHKAHREYLDCMVEAAERDGFVSEAEHEILLRIATQLQVDTGTVPAPDTRNAVPKPFPGMRICFTGQAAVGGRVWGRPDLQGLAQENGWIPVPSVTKKNCDVLVAADTSSASGKAKKARDYGKPVVSVVEFLDWDQSKANR